MVSKPYSGAHALRPLFLLSFMLFAWQHAAAQKIARQYTASVQANGTLYFIEPKLAFKGSEAPAELEYDLTYLDSKDSVTLNFTYISPELQQIDSLRVKAGTLNLSSPGKKIYVEDDKEDWKHRYSARFLYKDLASLLGQQQTPSLELSGKGGTTIMVAKTGKWKKQAAVLSRIFNLIEANRQ